MSSVVNIDNGMLLEDGSFVDETQNSLEGEGYVSTEDTILKGIPASCSCHNAPTSIEEYLAGTINLDVPIDVLARILLDRDLELGTPAMQVDADLRKLCMADLYKWACMGVTSRGTVSDTDNGWKHSDGGFTLNASDKKLLLDQANAIYEEFGEPTIGKTKIKIRSYGIRRADETFDCSYRKRVIK